MEKREFDIFELVRIVLANRLAIIILVIISGIGAVAYSLLTPEIWSSRASFYAVGSQSSSLPFNIPGMGGLASKFMGAETNTDALNFVTVMHSRTFSEDVIRKFDLIQYFKLTDQDPLGNMDDALRMLQKIVSIGYGEESGLITVQVETKSKALSKDIVDYYLERLEVYNREQKITKGKRNREFLEQRVNATRAIIDSLLLANRDFQVKNNAIDLETQSQALINSYAEIIAKRMNIDIEMELAKVNYGANSPLIENLQTRKDAMVKQIRELETSNSGLKPQYQINISNIPNLAEQLAQLQLNLEIQKKVFEFIYPQYEAARLEELRDMPSLELLDSPREAGRRVRPKRAMICIITVFAAYCLGVFLALFKEILLNNKTRISEVRNSLKKSNEPQA
ncbi:MAG: hypothetical protein CVU48_00685 [Candidatus Cloacimonetes bacterium HGW-Cloacimonetes-1]|jgi:capsule polysaccharide export protein KpsE/RkpR|nr:MAG: hypothetical protein CVU48_00685 [Candidatus Cloacimonetes bacterium HGW-Cloacimonetes-1]